MGRGDGGKGSKRSAARRSDRWAPLPPSERDRNNRGKKRKKREGREKAENEKEEETSNAEGERVGHGRRVPDDGWPGLVEKRFLDWNLITVATDAGERDGDPETPRGKGGRTGKLYVR
jgi:hypothetical protein